MSSIHLELLDKNQLEFFKKLKPFKKKTALAGETALCLQLGHRYSLDFDLFQEKPIHPKDINLIKKTLPLKKIVFKSSDIIIAQIFPEINFSLVYYWYKKPLFPKIDAGSLYLFDYRDIALDKSHTIGRRATWRDYFDLFYILKNKLYSLEEIIRNAKKKFGVDFSEEQFLTQLTYFEDLTQFESLQFVGKNYFQQEIKDFLIKEVTAYMKKILKIK